MTSEAKLQQDCYLHFHNSYPELRGTLWMVHNNAKDARQGAILKGMGMVKGVSDLMFLHDKTLYCIELKTEQGRLSPEQKQWGEQIVAQGGWYVVIRTLKDFCNFVQAVLNKSNYASGTSQHN